MNESDLSDRIRLGACTLVSQRLKTTARCLPQLLSAVVFSYGLTALAQVSMQPAPAAASTASAPTTTSAQSETSASSEPTTPPLAGSASSMAPPAATVSDSWPQLSKRQRQALSPLSAQWDELTPQQKQKWLTLAKTFLQLTDEEQMTMHSRMREWAALSPKQRSQARFNFNSTQSLPINDKRAQWEAYQSLPEQDKLKLSSGPKPPTKSAARSNVAPSNRLVSPPALPVDAGKAISRIAPSRPVDPKTLLPLRQVSSLAADKTRSQPMR
ncbi:hypothetical protein B9Z47_07325 [Limnohabitans sp. 2KL-1]|nr:hypothetical protein B9Z47_07325 [Limnohabitans sp. 2KL-1]